MTEKENLLRAVRFERPESIPVRYHINPACWRHYPESALRDLIGSHPALFPDRSPYSPPPAPRPWARAGSPYTDPWGCVWETTEDGITGVVRRHPLERWEALETYRPPDPETSSHRGPIDWEAVARGTDRSEANGNIRAGGLTHGHTFLRLADLRGYENLLVDMADDDPRLRRLIGMVEEFNLGLITRFLERVRVEWMAYPEDLGMQDGPMLSPEHFGRYIKPVYRRLMEPARDAGCVIHMHSDGDIRLLLDDVLDCGVDVINLQDLVNGIDWIAERLGGRVCVELDIDRARVTPRGTPAEIDALIREEVEKIGSREGGLMLTFGLYPGTPLQNAFAVADAMDRYRTYYS